MFDVSVPVPDGAPGLAALATALGKAGVGLEGGGWWAGRAHYLVEDGERAREVLAGLDVEVREVVVVPLEADVPGALGRLMSRLAGAGVSLLAQYSDHDNRKVLVVDDPARAREALA